jgi:hypothetical protein
MIKRLILWITIAAIIVMTAPITAVASGPVEKEFVYYIYWSGIRAGKAVLRYRIDDEHITIQTHATSASLISLIYKVDDRATSIIHPDGYPEKFILKVRQGRHKRDKVTYFDRLDGTGRQRVVFNNIRDDETIEYIFDDRPVYDPLSAFYEMTKWDLQPGRSEFIDIFDNKKLWHTEVKVLKRERIKVPAGEFDTILVKPQIQSEGIFLKTGDIYLWARDDETKLPIKMKSKAKIGHFTALLIEGDI